MQSIFAFLRDFIMTHDVITDSFETSVSWDQVISLCQNVVQEIRRKHKDLGLPGHPFVTYRITQLYRSGVCVHFYLATPVVGIKDPLGVFSLVEKTGRKTILRSSGSPTHHHEVGQHRKNFIRTIQSPVSLRIKTSLKNVLDISNNFVIRYQGLGGLEGWV